MRHPWTLVRRLREIAFMRNADDLLHQPERGRDFCRRGQERYDPAHGERPLIGCSDSTIFANSATVIPAAENPWYLPRTGCARESSFVSASMFASLTQFALISILRPFFPFGV